MEKIAYLGMGIMGSAMASNLVKAGYPVTVWNRTTERCDPVIALGATRADTPAEAVTDAEVIMYCFSDDEAVEAAVFGENGVLEGVHSGQIAVNMTTVYPALSLREAQAYAQRGVEFLDAPVFGSKGEVQAGGLWIVVGGKREIFDRVRPILEVLSETTHYMGGTGKGTSMKLVGNLLVAAQLESLGEAMVLATKAGLSPEDVLGVIKVADFTSPILVGVGGSLIRRDFEVSFALKHMLKDAKLISQFTSELNTPAPATAATLETIKAAVNHGWGEENASALIKALEMLANVQVGGSG